MISKAWTVAFMVMTIGGLLAAAELIGAGATFPYPLYSKMFNAYHKETGTKVNYQAIGSGGGILQLKKEIVDFGASDAYLSEKDLAQFKRGVVHIPIALGAVAITYNLPGQPELNLSQDVLEDIFLGRIKKWHDRRIKALNPDLSLPRRKIVVVYRSDGSGTTFIFTDFLNKIGRHWQKKVGHGKAVKWPVGIGAKGNAGVAGLVKQIPGAISYVEVVYTIQNKMPVAAIENRSGRFIRPGLDHISAAIPEKVPSDTRISITDTPAKEGYPIAGLTWILLMKDQAYKKRTLAQAMQSKTLVHWMVTNGQRFAKPLKYAPIPEHLQEQALTLLDTIHFNGETLTSQP